ncbi:UNVERIFIED_CONTAM: Midasin [Sesamum radiatum]|uniref:Midasin n=1 Tax=Sesamum radiatum TaxID=300843 RepID=A0AAW2PIP6_SESRA
MNCKLDMVTVLHLDGVTNLTAEDPRHLVQVLIVLVLRDLSFWPLPHRKLRVLRAMQLNKPGSPGVGKTSLIVALGRFSGHTVVRINLSEQTDIMDLLGSDLPIESDEGIQFAWSDGILLQALKKGSWVLLDELNLAPQSVLEGLNAILDHRAEVFIPELGRSFKCPTSFRVFACQNPSYQGGGRKGLPKSFLNRFTKPYVNPHPRVKLTPDTVIVGDVSVARNLYQSSGLSSNNIMDLPGLRHCLEAVAQCVKHQWLCILVGPPSSGKTSMVRLLAELTGNVLNELNLSSATDISELLGCFEQHNASRHYHLAIAQVERYMNEYCSLQLESSPDAFIQRNDLTVDGLPSYQRQIVRQPSCTIQG